MEWLWDPPSPAKWLEVRQELAFHAPSCLTASPTAWVRGRKHCQRDGIPARGKWGKNITQEPVRFFPWVPRCCRYTLPLMGDGVRELPPRSLCPHCVLCQMAVPARKVSSFFDMCLYAGDAFSFLKISFLARRRKGKTISKK